MTKQLNIEMILSQICKFQDYCIEQAINKAGDKLSEYDNYFISHIHFEETCVTIWFVTDTNIIDIKLELKDLIDYLPASQ